MLIIHFLTRKTKHTRSTILFPISSSQNIKNKTIRDFIFIFSDSPDCIQVIPLMLSLLPRNTVHRVFQNDCFYCGIPEMSPFFTILKLGEEKNPAKLKIKKNNKLVLRMSRPINKNCLLIITLQKIVYKMNRKIKKIKFQRFCRFFYSFLNILFHSLHVQFKSLPNLSILLLFYFFQFN